MVISVLIRKTAIRDPEEWRKRADSLVERLRPLLERQPGFVDVAVEAADDGSLRETTRWSSADDCRRYVREGGAAMVATIADALLPTAPYPNGAWVRETRDA